MNQPNAIDAAVSGLGYELVDVERAPGGLLRVTIDHPLAADGSERAVNVDDCERVTRQLQHVLEVEGLSYERLEVSSPGLDRPLKKEADFARFAGEQVELVLKVPFRGRKRYRGELQRRGDGWRIVVAPTSAVAAARRHAASSSGKKAAAAAGAAVAGDSPAGDAQALDFSLDEVREARLVPVIDFKGRATAPQGAATSGARPHEQTDGGRIR
ncbi:MAG: ribosome maturation factor RimP [Caldimonas sp.]